MNNLTPQEARAVLVARLRSGTVTQTRGTLGRPDGSRCCLGVACDIGVEYGIIPAPIEDPRSMIRKGMLYGVGEDVQVSSLPDAVRRFFGFRHVSGGYGGFGGYGSMGACNDSLMGDNDAKGHTFAQIADTVESRPPGMFED